MLYYSIFSDDKVDQWVKSEVILIQKFHEWENENCLEIRFWLKMVAISSVCYVLIMCQALF